MNHTVGRQRQEVIRQGRQDLVLLGLRNRSGRKQLVVVPDSLIFQVLIPVSDSGFLLVKIV